MNINVHSYDHSADSFNISVNDERFTVVIDDDALESVESADDSADLSIVIDNERAIAAKCRDYFMSEVEPH